MGVPNKRYVGRTVQGVGKWTVWDRFLKRTWGNPFSCHPKEVIDELNGQRRGEVLEQLTNKLNGKRK